MEYVNNYPPGVTEDDINEHEDGPTNNKQDEFDNDVDRIWESTRDE